MMTKRQVLLFFALAPLLLMAQAGQFNGTGWYRVQSVASERYMSLVDNTKIGIDGSVLNLAGFHTLKGFEDRVAFNPATVCYFVQVSVNGNIYTCNLKGQGMDLYAKTGEYLKLNRRPAGYALYGGSGAVKYLKDEPGDEVEVVPYSNGSVTDVWYMLPVNSGDAQYFGVKPDVTASADGSYWATMYASFPFTPTAGMTVYTVSRVAGEYAVVKPITGNVPQATPVLIRCAGSTPKSNKLTLLNTSPSAVSGNQLVGNYYCYVDPTRAKEHNVTLYDSQHMRVLGTTSDGKAAFVDDASGLVGGQYIPANKCYLYSSTPFAAETLQIVTEEEYTAGIDDVRADAVRRSGVYSVGGQRVADSTAGLPAGLYIAGGKKVVVK